jgi:hypothetical protein
MIVIGIKENWLIEKLWPFLAVRFVCFGFNEFLYKWAVDGLFCFV